MAQTRRSLSVPTPAPCSSITEPGSEKRERVFKKADPVLPPAHLPPCPIHTQHSVATPRPEGGREGCVLNTFKMEILTALS